MSCVTLKSNSLIHSQQNMTQSSLLLTVFLLLLSFQVMVLGTNSITIWHVSSSALPCVCCRRLKRFAFFHCESNAGLLFQKIVCKIKVLVRTVYFMKKHAYTHTCNLVYYSLNTYSIYATYFYLYISRKYNTIQRASGRTFMKTDKYLVVLLLPSTLKIYFGFFYLNYQNKKYRITYNGMSALNKQFT